MKVWAIPEVIDELENLSMYKIDGELIYQIRHIANNHTVAQHL